MTLVIQFYKLQLTFRTNTHSVQTFIQSSRNLTFPLRILNNGYSGYLKCSLPTRPQILLGGDKQVMNTKAWREEPYYICHYTGHPNPLSKTTPHQNLHHRGCMGIKLPTTFQAQVPLKSYNICIRFNMKGFSQVSMKYDPMIYEWTQMMGSTCFKLRWNCLQPTKVQRLAVFLDSTIKYTGILFGVMKWAMLASIS